MELLSDVASAVSNITPNLTISSAAKLLQILAATTSYVSESWPENSHVKHGDHFDFIIVGGGTAGCVLANRLTEVPDWRVLLIEYGGDPPLLAEIPGLFILSTHSPYDWDFYSANDGVTSQSQIRPGHAALTQGKMLGGSSCVEYLLYQRGSKSEFDSWPEGWNWDNVLKYFKKAENMRDTEITNGPTANYHCNKGPLKVTKHNVNEVYQKIEDDLLDAFAELGIKKIFDPNVPEPNGVSKLYFRTTDKIPRRSHSARGYLLPIKNDRPNFYILKDSLVTRILINDNKEAIGVRVSGSDGEIDVFADNEVIVTAGVFNTPKLLMLSGIGPAEHLTSFNIPVVKDLPVGSTYLDHPLVPVVTSGKRQLITNVEETALVLTDFGTFPLPAVGGQFTINDTLKDIIHFTIYYDPSSPIFLYNTAVNLNINPVTATSWILNNPDRALTLSNVMLGKPKSRGRVELRSTDPRDPPKIFTGYVSDPDDLSRLTEAVKYFYGLQNTNYFKEAGGTFSRPILPECDRLEFGSNDYWRCYVRTLVLTGFDSAGTCKMGLVTDHNLKVKGVKRLRLGDASVMFNLPSGKTAVVSTMIGERTADLIKKEYGKVEGFENFPCDCNK